MLRVRPSVHHEFLGERVAQSHVDGALELPLHRHGVERRAAVVRGVHALDLHLAGLGVHLHLGHLGAEAEGGVTSPMSRGV